MRLEELRQLAVQVEPITAREAPPGRDPEVRAFNDAVSRFRELVVAARNQIVTDRPVPPESSREIQILSEALPEERARIGRRGRASG